MIIKKNRRTLKKRIRRVMSLSAFVIVLFLSGLIFISILMLSKGFAAYEADIACTNIMKEIDSGNAIRELGIYYISEIDQNNPRTKDWIDKISKNKTVGDFLPFLKEDNNLFIKIEVDNKLVYSNEEKVNETTDFYKDTESFKYILDSNNNKIGSVSVAVNPHFILTIFFPALITVVALSIIALIIAKILGMFLVIPIINPINQLDTRIKALSDGDAETALNTEIKLKRPLREIESLADSTNVIMKKINSYNDILEEQNAELEAQNDALMESKKQIEKHQIQLVQAEKMASVGLLTAAITHEINTPIGAINSNAQLGEMLLNELTNNTSIQTDEELNTMVIQLKEFNDVNLLACGRITEIIKSLKSFSRLDQADCQEADINEGIKSVLVLTNNLLKNRINVHEEYGDIPCAKCFPGQLNQVFMNIIVNASQAIEGTGDIYITTYQQDEYIIISIKDTGTGIKEENIQSIFDPGFTTKGVGVGLGLGLYISYNIIQNHKGEITVLSEIGKGTEFAIKIPIDNQKT